MEMPAGMKKFLSGLNETDADEIDIWLDGDPNAIERMRDITYLLTVEGKKNEVASSNERKTIR